MKMRMFFLINAALLLSAPISSANDGQTSPNQSRSIGSVDCRSFSGYLANYRSRIFSPMSEWAGKNLRKLGTRSLTYLFSGADVATALSLFPSADHYTLIADQTPLTETSQEILSQQIQKECETVAYFSTYGYFRTNDLEGKDSQKPRFVKMLVYNILLSGGKIEQLQRMRVGDRGDLVAVTPGTPDSQVNALRFNVITADGRSVVVDYVKINLSDAGLSRDEKWARFVSDNLKDTVFIKSASHLLQYPYFSILAKLIVDTSRSVVQDETGLDIDLLTQHYQVESFGKFVGPQALWQESQSAKRLKKYLDGAGAMRPLGFTIGYEKAAGSILLIGTKPQPPSPPLSAGDSASTVGESPKIEFSP